MAKEYIEREKAIEWFMAFVHMDESDIPAETVISDLKYAIPAADVIQVPNTGIGDVSDGYHTFNELYHHRAVLFSVICNLMPEKAWKSKQHDTGDMYDGMFIVGIETPEGQATYHYDIDPYWDMFNVKEVEHAPKWDGHTASDTIERIGAIPSTDLVEAVRCKDCVSWEKQDDSRQGRCDLFNLYTGKGWYCAGGERKDD